MHTVPSTSQTQTHTYTHIYTHDILRHVYKLNNCLAAGEALSTSNISGRFSIPLGGMVEKLLLN